jgi:hypothetical protein
LENTLSKPFERAALASAEGNVCVFALRLLTNGKFDDFGWKLREKIQEIFFWAKSNRLAQVAVKYRKGAP